MRRGEAPKFAELLARPSASTDSTAVSLELSVLGLAWGSHTSDFPFPNYLRSIKLEGHDIPVQQTGWAADRKYFRSLLVLRRMQISLREAEA